MNGGVFMTGKADETNFALLFGFLQRFSGASRTHKKFWIVVEGYAVNLPKVQVISLQSVERLLEHLHGQGSVPCVHTFVIRKSLSRRPLSALPIQSSLFPRWYSQQLSKNVIPLSTAS